MPKAAKKKPPSRVRYEQSHPTVSCRVPKEVYDRLRVIRRSEGRSFADVLKIGLGILEVGTKEEAEIRKQGHAEGHKRGYAEADRLYKVTYRCAVCRKTITIDTEDEKQAVRQYMQEHGWGHAECHERQR